MQLNEVIAQAFEIATSSNATPVPPIDTVFGTQYNPAEELRVISKPPSSAQLPLSRFHNYVFPRPDHANAYIYHAEHGINSLHEDFAHRRIEWLFTDLQIERDGRTRSDASANGHSTCTASKAAGTIYGSAKDATLVVVKMPDYKMASIAEIMSTIWNDIREKDREDRSLVSISWGSTEPISWPLDYAWREFLKTS